MKKKKCPNPNFGKCSHLKWFAIINTKRRQLLTWVQMDNICWMNIYISSSFYSHVSKHQNNLICICFCCVSNFTYKFIMRKKNLFGLTHHESQPGGHLVVYQQLCFHYSYVTWSGSSRGTKIEGAGAFSWLLSLKWAFPAHSGNWARANRRAQKEQTRQLRGERLQAHRTFLALPGSPEKREHKRGQA